MRTQVLFWVGASQIAKCAPGTWRPGLNFKLAGTSGRPPYVVCTQCDVRYGAGSNITQPPPSRVCARCCLYYHSSSTSSYHHYYLLHTHTNHTKQILLLILLLHVKILLIRRADELLHKNTQLLNYY
ncbi:hypothetical protein T492DRAFT_289110 [Pavlovales sp. CCMP2436]|nr:hypothetical protein T492DRAFT_289110 [Pavlovales sp. CCMP2436]